MRRSGSLSSNIHPGYTAYTERERSAAVSRPTYGRTTTIDWVTTSILIVTAAVQITLAYQFYQVRQEIKAPEVQTRLESMEQRFSKISVVLRFLLDKSKDHIEATSEQSKETTQQGPPESNDLPLARVTSTRLNLRAGPGTNHAPLMTVSAGTILVVEDTSQAPWVRVVAPNGARAYALRDQLSFTDGE